MMSSDPDYAAKGRPHPHPPAGRESSTALWRFSKSLYKSGKEGHIIRAEKQRVSLACSHHVSMSRAQRELRLAKNAQEQQKGLLKICSVQED